MSQNRWNICIYIVCACYRGMPVYYSKLFRRDAITV